MNSLYLFQPLYVQIIFQVYFKPHNTRRMDRTIHMSMVAYFAIILYTATMVSGDQGLPTSHNMNQYRSNVDFNVMSLNQR